MIQGQQAEEDLTVGKLRGVVGPSIGGGDGFIKSFVGHVQPVGTGVVEVGQGTFFEVGLITGLGNWALGEAGFFLFRGYDPINPLGRIQPVFAEMVEFDGSIGDSLGGAIGLGVRSARPTERCVTWRQVIGKGKVSKQDLVL